MCAAAACGWRAGPVDVGFVAGAVEGATVEPAVRAAIRDGLARALATRGAGPGPAVQVRVVSTDNRGLAALPGVDAGTVAYEAVLVVEATVTGRPRCLVQVEDARVWTQPSAAPLYASASRAEAYAALAGSVAERVVDAVLGRSECR